MTQTFDERVAALALAADADLFNRNVVNMRRIAEVMLSHSGKTPALPSQTTLGEVYELLFQIANPTGRVGQASGGDVPEYPTEYLPAAMRAQLKTRGALHPAGIGAGMLACASASCLATRLLVDGTRKVLPTLWVPAIGIAGNGKTPAFDITTKPFKDREKREVATYVREMIHWKSLDKKDRSDKPVNGSLIMADATAEILVRRLNTSLQSAVFMPDELAVLLLGFGAWKKGDGQAADKGRLLEMWSGSPWPYERVGSGEDPIFIYIEEPVVPMSGTIQPDYVRYLGDVGSGMQARWLPHLVGDRVGQEIGYTADEWTKTIDRLLHCLHSKREWTMNEGSQARAEHRAAELRWDAEKRSVEQTPASSAFLAKGGEHALRVALLYAEIDAASEALKRGGLVQTGELPAWAVRGGIQLVDYCAAVWRVLGTTETGLSMSFADRAIAEKDDKLNAWLHGRQDKCATVYEITKARVAGCRTKKEVTALVERHREIHGEDSVVAHRANGFLVYAR